MADISAQNIPELGRLMEAYPSAESAIQLQGAQGQLAGAQAQEAGARTGLLGVQTQQAQLEIQMIKNAMNLTKNLGMGSNEGNDEKSGIDPTETGVASSLNQKFYVDPLGNPKLIQASMAYNAANKPQVAAQFDKLNDTLVKSQISKNQAEARDIFQTSSKLSESSNPLQAMLSLRPGSYLNNVGRAIASNPNMSGEEKDAAAATALKAASKYAHQYTGEDLDKAGSQFVGKNSGFPVNAPPIGRTPGEQQQRDIAEHTPQTVVSGNRETTVYPDLSNPPGATTPAASGSSPGPGTVPAGKFSPDQVDFIKSQPDGFPQIPGSSKPNPDDANRMSKYREQAVKLAESTNIESARAQDTLTQIGRVNNLLKSPSLTLGPASHEYSQFRTVLENWLGIPSGQAAAYQALTKVLNASEMNDLLQQLHSEGAQVRLGAYESRLIMEKLAANPNITKTAIQQMLQWQASDAKYAIDKTKVAGGLIDAGKSVTNFDKEYGAAFPKKDIVDSTLNIINPQSQKFSYEKVHGKTYTNADVVDAATKLKVPISMLKHQLEQNGAIIAPQ